MDRRGVLTSLLILPVSDWAARSASSAGPMLASVCGVDVTAPSVPLKAVAASGPITSSHDGQVIENLDINASSGNGITVTHNRIAIRNCRIRHATGHGVLARDAAELLLEQLEIDHVGARSVGPGPSEDCNNITLERCQHATVRQIKASRGSSNIYVANSAGAQLSLLELHDARGPAPRGQNVQFNASPRSILEDFSAENGPTSWTEDNVSVFRSDDCVVRRGLVFYNNSPTGDGVMIEGSSDCRVEDVDAIQQGNGAFAAVPEGDAGSGGCTFIRCRTCQSYNTPRDGRAAPSSKGLSIYIRISAGAPKHTIIDCQYHALANPRNLIWDLRAVKPGWSFTRHLFAPRPPIRLVFNW